MEHENTAQTLTFRIEGLDCPDCAASLEKAVQALPGVAAAQLSFAASTLAVTPTGQTDIVADVQKVAETMGHHAVLQGVPAQARRAGPLAWLSRHRQALNSALAGLLILVAFVLQLSRSPQVVAHGLYVAAILVGGVYVARAGWAALRTAHTLDMNALMSIAALGAIAVGEFAEGAVAIWLFSIGELLESYSMDRARNAIRALMALAPAEATLLRDGEELRVPVASIRIGDRLVIKPGERLPMDGRVLEGRSAINQAPVTGESIPVEKGAQDEVFAGTINGQGALVIEVTRLAQDNTIARIMRMVEEAQSQRAPSQRFVDRFARVYTPIVIALAIGIAVLPPLFGLGSFSQWLYRALVLLVISCPCALVISTPVTIVSALARAARAGVLIKGGKHLEMLGALRVVAFDKTGTLTRGKPRVVEGSCALRSAPPNECSACQDLLAKAAAVEGRSEHILSQAVVEYAKTLGVAERYAPGQGVTAITGMGIEGQVEGHHIFVGSHAYCHQNGSDRALCETLTDAERRGYTVLVIQDDCCDASCYLLVSDELREGAADVIREMRRAGIRHTAMLTGDNASIAQTIAEQAGVDEVRAGLLPEDKVRAVEELRARHGQIAMVGDGVNDAPALAKASVGVVMGAAGTDTALETADIALMSDDLSRLPFAIRLSQRALNIVRANIAFSIGIKALFLALAVAGYSTLWMAVMADVGASLLVTLNGLRMLAFRERKAT